jgi:hypothetical protein
MPTVPRAPAPAAGGRVSIDAGAHRPDLQGEDPLLDIGAEGRGGLHERLMPHLRPDARGGIRRVESPRGVTHTRPSARHFAYELLFVKGDGAEYVRPYLRTPGQIIEALLLCAIFMALALSIMDSFNEFETNHPESHCWYHCCKHKSGRCSAAICDKHKDDANKTSPVDETCSVALVYKGFRDDTTWVLLTLFTLEYMVRVWCCIEDPSLPRHPVTGRLRWMRKVLHS